MEAMSPFDFLDNHLDGSSPVAYDEIRGPSEFIASWHGHIETSFGAAGFYGGRDDVRPYPDPTTRLDDAPATKPPTVVAKRRLWMARFNPADDAWLDGGVRTNDPVDPGQFPWHHPEMADRHGWWLSTDRTPRNRVAIDDIAAGDLVLVQRTAKNPDRVDNVPNRSIIGVAVAWGDCGWTGNSTAHRDVCLVPLTFFDYPVPVQTAQSKTWGRLNDLPSMRDMPQLHGQRTTHGRTLSAVNWNDVPELCSVCNIHPDVFTDPLPVVAARLRRTETGNKALWRFRWDHVFRSDLRRENERRAVASARAWAAARNYVYVTEKSDAQREKLAGFDFRVYDAHDTEVQIEVKGYSTKNLADVHLQPSQVKRARQSAAGTPPAWYLHVLLSARSRSPQAQTFTASETVDLIDRGLLNRRP